MLNYMEKLPDEIINEFAKRMNCVDDSVRFSAVCKLWQNSMAKIRKEKHIPFGPWLMLSTYNEDQGLQTFYDISREKIVNLPLPHNKVKERRCFGSQFGWLVTIGVDLHIHLLNPLSGIQISLPSQPTFQHQYKIHVEPEDLRHVFMTKFILSSNPSDSDQTCIVIAIHSELRRLSFAKPGDEAWTYIESSYGGYQDAIFFRGQFYAINSKGVLVICEIDAPHPKTIDFAFPPEDIGIFGNRFYLIEMSGELLLIERLFSSPTENASLGDFYYITEAFDIYKFDFHSSSWVDLYDLGDHALFVGDNTSFSISTIDYPEFRRSCIYFTDDHRELFENRFCDMGICDFKEGTIEPIYLGDHVLSMFSRPMFVMPTL
ncbi:hypothetical protein AQUCO_02000347v1 [Aquilegia coerulea]|uniref:KIB1-4 beta-propeller domain-containing protein n=1 Tax=Aquilegia coerulea TaxID=218851 RepID=A0A2G5DH76_AQUCA|nr:hypothetical protein AQUCO_02000347v1 [Aquilegia coerulea]